MEARRIGVMAIVLIPALLVPGGLWAKGEGEAAAASGKPVALRIFQEMPTTFKEENNPVIAHLEKRLNLDLSFEVPPIGAYGDRQRLVIASGEYPDAMMFGSNPDDPILLDAVDNGVVKPVTKWVKNAPNIQKYTNPISWAGMKLKGNDEIYAVPGNTVVRADGYFLRKDWLDNVGLSLGGDHSVSLDEFTEILKRFTKNDPDGNGKDDTFGITAGGAGGPLPLMVGWPFGVGTSTGGAEWFQKVEGEPYAYMDLRYSRTKDNMKKALEYNRMLWEKGYIDPNWPSNTGTQMNERVFTGKAGMRFSFGGHVYNWLASVKKNNPNATGTYITAIRSEKGVTQGPGFGTGLYRINTVLKEGKQEALVRYLDYLLSDEGFDLIKFGLEGIHFNMAGDKRTFTPEYPNYSWRTYLAVARRYDDPVLFMDLMQPKEIIDQMSAWVSVCMKNVVMSEDFGYRPKMATEQGFIDYRTTMDQAVAKIITGQLPVSEWDKVLDGWYKAGGERYLKEINDFIARKKK